jgi:hypothetical protein
VEATIVINHINRYDVYVNTLAAARADGVRADP